MKKILGFAVSAFTAATLFAAWLLQERIDEIAANGGGTLDLVASSVWAQVSVYALADEKWHRSFRPEGVKTRDWADQVAEHICNAVFMSIYSKESGGARTRRSASPI